MMSNLPLDISRTDEDFFDSLGSGHSSLTQIFGVKPRNQQENHSLKYQPPPKQLGSTYTDAQQSWSSQMAKVVTAYKDSIAMGKVGVALLRNAKDEYKIIVYKSKTNVLATCTLQFSATTTTAVYRQQPYLQFYDGSQSYWSLLFEKEDDETEFVKILQTIAVKIIELESEPKPLPCIAPLPAKKEDIKTVSNRNNALVTRVAKLGQKLPQINASTTTECSEESTDTEVITTPLACASNKHGVVCRNRHSHPQKPAKVSKSVGIFESTSTLSSEAQCMQIMLSENRTQNTEMRMNINKLECKLDKFLDKIESLSSGITVSNTASRTLQQHKDDETLQLEERLMELRKENRRLRQSLESNNCQKSIEKFVSDHNSQLQELKLSASTDWEELSDDLLSHSLQLNANLQSLREKHESMTQQLREKNSKLTEQKQQMDEQHEKVKEIEDRLQEANKTNDKLRHSLHELKEQLQAHEGSDPHKKLASETRRAVKEIMNSLYSSLASQLDAMPSGNLSTEHVLSIVGKLIKYETLQAIQSK